MYVVDTLCGSVVCVFFFKQKTAYEMRISDWSSDVCSSDLPRRAMGHLLGHGVRFGLAGEVMAFGEGIETMLSLHEIAPRLPLVAGLSAAHLAALEFAAPLRRLYVARERDGAGRAAFATDRKRTRLNSSH